ncbi:hypothetical protein NLM31_07520 [Bradyrhizobium sp. CCGUVB4N]|uniref:hypothetical protein n=1 Tax=Bradyrhizobium sp. CCGUVB4N TaxID=2949631 RepID=UPI0020B405AA|nr:hypothetical protein [Bradyrhizobium sp. CCGUVB4N]MCP3380246.1 hypothetical protein [Bradyrhizobium sp. CCGUVB4N]
MDAGSFSCSNLSQKRIFLRGEFHEKTSKEATALIGSIAMTDIAAGFNEAIAASRVSSASKKLYWFTTVTPCDKIGQFGPGAMRAFGVAQAHWRRCYSGA